MTHRITREQRVEGELELAMGAPFRRPTDEEFAAWVAELALEKDLGVEPRAGYWASYEAGGGGVHWFESFRLGPRADDVQERPLCGRHGTVGAYLRFEKFPVAERVCLHCWLRVREQP